MWPKIRLPGIDLAISSYHLLHVVGWFAFFLVGSHLTRSRPDLRRHWAWLAVGLAACDTAGARVAYRLVRGWHESGFTAAPLLFATVTGAYVIARKVRAWPFLDAWAVAFSAASVFEKGACLAAGCCFGRPTDFMLGIAIHSSHGDPGRYQPLPLYESSLHLLTAFALWSLYSSGRFRGLLAPILGVVFGLWRSAIEIPRAGRRPSFLDGPLSITQVACIMAIAFSVTYLLLCRGEGDRPGLSAGVGAGRE